jgi:hypothetical protein
MQVIGGLIVLYSIDTNMGMFKNHGLVSIIRNWFGSFPLLKRTVTLDIQDSVHGSASCATTLTVNRKCNTIEERLDELERRIEDCHQVIHEKARLLNERVEQVRTELSSSLSGHGAELNRLSTLIENSVVGATSPRFSVALDFRVRGLM